jgi:hypothetical protein
MDDQFAPTSSETRVRVQGDRETARGDRSADRVSPPWKIGDRLNDFVLEKMLGKGTSGFVYRALDLVTHRRCALKLLLPGTPEDLVRNKLGFRRMMSIQHPSLLHVDRIHQLGEYIALSMEEVDGETLPQAIKRMRGADVRSSYRQLLKLTRQYAAGLAAMHVNGYVHRDIKPQNLMVDRDGNGWVIDYGLVGTFDPETDPHGYRHYLVGTPRYIAPEVLWNQFYLPAGDIFGLGVVMLESLRSLSIVTGAANASTVQRSDASPNADARVITEAIEGLDESVPADLREMCLEMLQRDPAERPTAMRVARLGDPSSAAVVWPQENPLIGRHVEVGEVCRWLDEIYVGAVGRLHLSGPSGIGKTRLVDDIEKYVRSMRWGQVFRAHCRSRETQPLQAFDQICDSIANRYRQGDREPLELDPVSVTILHNAFPALRNVVRRGERLSPPRTSTERLDALEAAARMSHELRNVGPLILIIDDVQWADRDSLNVLDRLQGAGGEIGLGIITVSRDATDAQHVPATRSLHLQPLSRANSISMLADAARSWGVPASESVLGDLADAAAGSPFRLHELVDELKPGGALSQIGITIRSQDDSVSRLGRIDWLWQKRAERLSEDAHRVLAFVVTAGTSVSTQQLGLLTGLEDAVDAAVSELVQQRLVSDEATGGECIRIVHDRVADGLVQTLAPRVKRNAHLGWADLLVREDHPERQAARIAGHYFAAGEPGRAVSFAVLAAEDAERLLAKTEAARWHARVIDHVDGAEKVARIRHAARCFQEADHPLAASQYYQRLAKCVEEDERIQCQMLAASMAIRGGDFCGLREQLGELATTLRLPRPKPASLSQLVLAARSVRSLLSTKLSPATLADSAAGERTIGRRDQQALRLCISLIRPVSMFDGLYAAELSMTAEALAEKFGTPYERAHSIIGKAVFGCCDRGAKRREAEMLLQEMEPDVERLHDARATGDLWAGVAYSHMLSCRWHEVVDAVKSSVQNYQSLSESSGFEIAHTEWLRIWAYWHLGRWDSMFRVSDTMFDDAVRRNDQFKQLVVTRAYGCCAWLGRDRGNELDRLCVAESRGRKQPVQLLDLFAVIASLQRMVYGGKYDEAWNEWKSLQWHVKQLPYRKMQFVRIVCQSLGALIALHRLGGHQSPPVIRHVLRLVGQLRRERLAYADVLANLYDGLLQRRQSIGKTDARANAARGHLHAAHEQAGVLGLRPIQLAAADALAEIDGDAAVGQLREAMHVQGIACPECFERLYTVPPAGAPGGTLSED